MIEECLDSGSRCGAGPCASSRGRSADPPRRHGVADRHRAPGAANGAICLFSDLTDVVELEEQLRLKDGLAQVGELTAGIAHEFRNGLATIHGYARLLDLERLPADMRPYVIGIRDETDTLGAVVRNFLNFAKPAELVLGSGGHARDRRARRRGDSRRGGRSGAARVTVRGEFVPVPGDEVLLRQAFSNLCRNALEACTEAASRRTSRSRAAPDRAAARRAHRGRSTTAPASTRPGAPHLHAVRDDARARHRARASPLVQKIVVTHNGRVTRRRPSPAAAPASSSRCR